MYVSAAKSKTARNPKNKNVKSIKRLATRYRSRVVCPAIALFFSTQIRLNLRHHKLTFKFKLNYLL
eukprot:m.51895 g.51895  ORF g.51895 m.51895 type:complete len:66 (+) comp10761_c0_seq3:1444-1641(+)